MCIRDRPYTDYGSQNIRYEKIANLMPLKRYKKIRKYLHAVDNNFSSDDRHFKIRPVLDAIKKKSLSAEEEKQYSTDEMMIPYSYSSRI